MSSYKIIINKKSVKHYYIKLKSKELVEVVAPLKATQKSIDDLLDKKRSWIERNIHKINDTISQIKEFDFIDYLGRRLEVVFYQDTKDSIDFTNNKIIFYLKNSSIDDNIKKQKLLDSFYKQQSIKIFTPIAHEYANLIGKNINKITIRKAKTRWGSCNHKKGYINLNQELIKKDIKAVRAVIFHEVAHLVHPNHSRKFYSFIASYMPEYKQIAKKYL